MMKTKDILAKALEHKNKSYYEAEKAKEGKLRFGNSGIWFRGQPVGSCARKTVLRFFGIQEITPPEKELMFEAGRRNEDTWSTLLNAIEVAHLQEEECPAHRVVDGIELSGRPDIVLVGHDGHIARGLELKNVSSLWTAKDVVFESKPKTAHLIQAGHYGWALDIPFELWYTSAMNWHLPDWVSSKYDIPAHNKPGSEKFNYGFYRTDHVETGEYYKTGARAGQAKTKKFTTAVHIASEHQHLSAVQLRKQFGIDTIRIKSTQPFQVGFDVAWDGNYLGYTKHDEDDWKDTIITKSGIDDFYSSVITSINEKKQLPRPLDINFDESEQGFKTCDYCSFKLQCDKYESNFTQWLGECKQSIKE